MILTSKYDLNQKVYKIWRLTETIGTPCGVCSGTGRLALVNGGSVPCTHAYKSPHCDNGKVRTELVHRWAVTAILTIGQVRAQATVPRGCLSDDDNGVRYMCYETGVGSGTVHNERDLFATRDEALAECEARNVGCDTSPTEDTIQWAYDADEEWEAEHAEEEAA